MYNLDFDRLSIIRELTYIENEKQLEYFIFQLLRNHTAEKVDFISKERKEILNLFNEIAKYYE